MEALKSALRKIGGAASGRRAQAVMLARLLEAANRVAAHAALLGKPDEAHFAERMARARGSLRSAGTLNAALPSSCIDALALIAVACTRALGFAPRTEQIMAALAMHEGYLVELAPGEGKTLAIAMRAILAVWGGETCHVVAGSDALATSSAAAMRPLFSVCGCTVAAITHDTAAEQLRDAYLADIVYATGRQLLSDYMRDQMLLPGNPTPLRRSLWAWRSGEGARLPVTRMARVAVVDDAESVLIEEALSPIVISAAGTYSLLEGAAQQACELVRELAAGRDYFVTEEPVYHVEFTEHGSGLLADLATRLPPFWRRPDRREDLLSQAILARDVLQRDRHYVLYQGRVILVNENVQQRLAGRPWHFGVVQAVEAREGLALTVPPRTLARTALQEFYPRYRQLCGAASFLTGLQRELRRTYRAKVLRIPSSAPARYDIRVRYEFATRADKLAAFVETIDAMCRAGLPVLANTQRVADLAEIGAALTARGVEFAVIEGHDQTADANLLAAFGRDVSVILTSGLAVCGLPGKLNQTQVGRAEVQTLLFEHYDSPRADHALFALANRRGLAGKALAFAALDDRLLARQLPWWAGLLRQAAQRAARRERHVRLLVPLAQWNAQRTARRYRQLILQRELQLDQQLAFSRTD